MPHEAHGEVCDKSYRLFFCFSSYFADYEPSSPDITLVEEAAATSQSCSLTVATDDNGSLATATPKSANSRAAIKDNSSLAAPTQKSTAATEESGNLFESSTPRPQKRKRKSINQMEIDKLEDILQKDEDEPAIFGQLVAKRMRACPRSMWPDIEIDILSSLKKYTT